MDSLDRDISQSNEWDEEDNENEDELLRPVSDAEDDEPTNRNELNNIDEEDIENGLVDAENNDLPG